MARFYKTAKPQFIDKNIYEPPTELMIGAIDNADNQIQANETALLSLYDKLQAQGLQADEPRLKEIIGGYQSSIEEMAKKIQSDPLAFRKEMGNIRQLSRTIGSDWTNGEVSAIQSNKGLRDKWVSEHLEKTKKEKGYVTQDDMTFAQKRFDEQFKGTDYKGPGDYNTYKTEALNPFVNLGDISEDRAKGYIADVVTNNGAWTDGKYMYTSENKKEIVPFDVIKKGVIQSMANDRELMAYYGQQVRLGKFTQQEVADMMNSSADVVAEKYSYKKEEGGKKSITGDPFALEKMRQANRWQMKMADWNREDKKTLAGPVLDANVRTGEQLDILNRGFSSSLFQLANKIGVVSTRTDGRLAPQDIRNKISTLKRLAKTPEQRKAIEDYGNQLNVITSTYNSGQVKASWAGFGSVYGNDVATAAQKQMEKYTKDPRTLYNIPMNFSINGKTFEQRTMYDVYNNPASFGLPKDAFVKNVDGETTKRDIKEIFVQGSQVPVMVSDKPEDWMYNDMIFQFEGDDINIEGQTSFGNLGIDYIK